MPKKAIALCTSDWHLRTTVPCSRAETNWFEVMEARMAALKRIQLDLGEVPILVAGDLVDRADPPSSLVAWAIKNLPRRVYCCPGQHDLLSHRYEDRFHGAYGALVRAGAITDLEAGEWHWIAGLHKLYVWPMPWGRYDLPPPESPGGIRIAMLHKYVWSSPDTKHVGAEADSNVVGLTAYAQHFDAISIGDNHTSWKAGKFCNHGSLFKTTSAQKDHCHMMAVVYDDGTVASMPFPEDAQWVEAGMDFGAAAGSSALVAELGSIENDSVSFETALQVLEDKSDARTKAILAEVRAAVFR